ncbi:type I secretion system permease/ATPase [Alphaproteobacteria bacterium]|nr:type I secretion system permease/ATPase [Alphaproteobacteria bacterium]
MLNQGNGQRPSDQTLKDGLRRCRGSIFITIFFSMFINLLMFVAPLHMLQIYDRVLVSRSDITLLVLTLLALGLLVVYGFLEGIRSRVLVRAGLKFDEFISDRVFRATFEIARKNSGSSTASQALRDMDNVREFVSGMAVVALCDAPWVPIFIAIGFFLHPALGFVSLGGAIIIFILATINEFITRNLLNEGSRYGLAATSMANRSLRNAEVIHALGMVGALKEHWGNEHNKALKAQTYASDRSGALMAASRFTRMALQVTILGVGAYLAIYDEITPGTMIAASIIMGRALAPVEMAVGQWKNIIAIRGAYSRLEQMLAVTDPLKEQMELPKPQGNISAEDLVVIPPGSQDAVVKGLNFSLDQGSSLAIIGPSGSGKSSLLRALVGIWRPSRGVVRYDAADLQQLNNEELGPYIGFMPQSIELLDGTIASNISRFGDVDADEVVTAAKKAGIHELILKFPDGYDTKMGANGKTLSGGERQRIALARALYGSPKLLILDEPNSNLDMSGEAALAKALEAEVKAGTTIIVVSHRQALLSVVDNVMVLRDGVMVHSGPREQVLQQIMETNQ